MSGIVSLLPVPGTTDPNVKSNIENINQYGVNVDTLNNYINSNNQYLNKVVFEVASIDLKTTGLTTLYTVPTGYKFFLDQIIFECTEATSITVESTIDIGFNDPDYNNITDNLLLEDLIDTSLFFKATISGSTKIMTAGDILKMNVVTASTGTSQTVKAYVSGLLRSV